MIKVQVPELKAEDVERVRLAMESITAAMRTMAPIVGTLLIPFSQQVAIVTKTFRDQVAAEEKRREEARRAGA